MTEEQGLRPIGSLIANCVTSPGGLALIQGGKRESSATTGTPNPARTDASSTGPQPGAAGAVALPSNLQTAIAAGDSLTLENLIEESLPSRARLSIRPRWDSTFDNLLGVTVEYRIDPAEAQHAVAIIDATAPKPSRDFLIAELTRVILVTKAKEGEESEMRARLEIYVQELSQFPADAVRTACREWARKSAWRPSLAELYGLCQRYSRKRLMYREALLKAGGLA